MSNKQVEVYAEALRRQREEEKDNGLRTQDSSPQQENTQKDTLNLTRKRDKPHHISSEISRIKSRETLSELPTRDEIQEFSFRLRDSLKVKVQAEVPHEWQDELEEVARKLDVKKLELYRFIIGQFLGKVKRKKPV